MNPKHRHRFYPTTDASVWRSMTLGVNVVCRPNGTGVINVFWDGAPSASLEVDTRMSLPQALHYLATIYQLEGET